MEPKLIPANKDPKEAIKEHDKGFFHVRLTKNWIDKEGKVHSDSFIQIYRSKRELDDLIKQQKAVGINGEIIIIHDPSLDSRDNNDPAEFTRVDQVKLYISNHKELFPPFSDVDMLDKKSMLAWLREACSEEQRKIFPRFK